MNNQKNFYQGTRLVTLFQANEQTSLVLVRGGILAQAVMRSNNCVVELLTVDAQRSVKQVSSVLAASINYTPYGYFQKNNILSLLAYTGERLDQASQCYLLGNGRRSYSPVLQRFLSPDPLSPFSSGGLNSYVYCLGDPVNFSDPSGFTAWSWFKSKLSKHVLTKVPGFKSAIRKARQQEQEGYKGREQEHLRSLESERSKSSALRAEVTGLKTKMANLEADLKRYELANGAELFEVDSRDAQSNLLNRAFELMGAPNVPAELMLPKPDLSKFGWEKDDFMILFLKQRNHALRARDEIRGIISAGVRSS